MLFVNTFVLCWINTKIKVDKLGHVKYVELNIKLFVVKKLKNDLNKFTYIFLYINMFSLSKKICLLKLSQRNIRHFIFSFLARILIEKLNIS